MKRLFVLLGQMVKFGIVGVSNTLISLGVYYLLAYLGVHYLIANTAGFFASILNAYFWSSRYIFARSETKSKGESFLKTFVSYGISFLVSSGLIYIMVNFLNISQWLAPLLRLVVTVPLNFIMIKLWAFNDKRGL